MVLFRSFLSSRRISLKRLSRLRLPRFGIRVFLLLRYSRSAVPYLSIFGTVCRGRPARDTSSSIRRPEDAPLRRCTPARGVGGEGVGIVLIPAFSVYLSLIRWKMMTSHERNSIYALPLFSQWRPQPAATDRRCFTFVSTAAAAVCEASQRITAACLC